MAEYKSRSNDPRITMGGKKDKYKYDMALEVARQPATTPERKRMKKDAQNYVRAFESRFQNEAFVRSGRDPYTAGGTRAAKDETKVDKVGKSKPASKAMLKKQTEKMKQNTRVKITGTASTTPRVSGSMIKSQPKTTSKSPSIKVTKKITEAPKRTPKNAQTLRRFAKKAGNK
jgi:hypothetical protein